MAGRAVARVSPIDRRGHDGVGPLDLSSPMQATASRNRVQSPPVFALFPPEDGDERARHSINGAKRVIRLAFCSQSNEA